MTYKKSKKSPIDKKEIVKSLKPKSFLIKDQGYKDLELETIKSTRDNFLVWKDFSTPK